ncbi:MAG: thermonuclease family protein [Microgenomates group bacterium]|nr:thermonuclease family protein [Microgenomates group bacterium]
MIILLISCLFLLRDEIEKKPLINHILTGSPTVTNRQINIDQRPVMVIRVIDGDTIVLENNQKLRYIGIDAPETVNPKKEIECFGKEASEKNRQLVEGKYVYLEKDVSETDKYGRLLRYVWLKDQDNATGEALFVNDYLVSQGFAFAATFPPDVKYAKRFLEAEKEARNHRRGLWSSCSIN